MAEYLYRTGGETVRVPVAVKGSAGREAADEANKYTNGITEREYKKLIKQNPDAKSWQWNVMTRNPEVYVKGKIRHSDHKTLDLGNTWHKVLINTENQAWAARNVAFLD